MPDKLVADPVTGLFPVVFCCLCKFVRTQHRCLAVVTRGGKLFGRETVCALPICGPCNADYNEENIFRCPEHSEQYKDTEDKENEAPKTKRTSTSKLSVSSKQPKQADYTAKDLLVLAQAYVRTSENAIDGASQKRSKFWDDVASSFNVLKRRQEDYDKRLLKKKKYNQVILKGQCQSSDESEDEVQVIVPPRTASSLQQKWSKFLLPLVSKFIGLTTRHPKLSGEGN